MKINNKGITLVALVVTVIVLLILAGISVATITGGDGTIDKAQEAKIQSDKSNAKEELEIKVIQYIRQGKTMTEIAVLLNAEPGITCTAGTGGVYNVTYKGFEFVYSNDNQIDYKE